MKIKFSISKYVNLSFFVINLFCVSIFGREYVLEVAKDKGVVIKTNIPKASGQPKKPKSKASEKNAKTQSLSNSDKNLSMATYILDSKGSMSFVLDESGSSIDASVDKNGNVYISNLVIADDIKINVPGDIIVSQNNNNFFANNLTIECHAFKNRGGIVVPQLFKIQSQNCVLDIPENSWIEAKELKFDCGQGSLNLSGIINVDGDCSINAKSIILDRSSSKDEIILHHTIKADRLSEVKYLSHLIPMINVRHGNLNITGCDVINKTGIIAAGKNIEFILEKSLSNKSLFLKYESVKGKAPEEEWVPASIIANDKIGIKIANQAHIIDGTKRKQHFQDLKIPALFLLVGI